MGHVRANNAQLWDQVRLSAGACKTCYFRLFGSAVKAFGRVGDFVQSKANVACQPPRVPSR